MTLSSPREMASSTSPAVYKPMSIREIASKAQDFEFDLNIALKYWLRTADALIKEAYIYERERNDQQAYLLLMRYATLVIDKISQHPEANEAENKGPINDLVQTVPSVLRKLEALRPKINSRHEAWLQERQANPALETEVPERSLAASDPAVAGNRATLAGADHPDLAVRVAHKEIRRRDAARRATRQAGISQAQEQQRRSGGLWDDWDLPPGGKSKPDDDMQLQRQMQQARQAQEDARNSVDGSRDEPKRSSKVEGRSGGRATQPTAPSTNYSYPQVARPQPLQYDRSHASQTNGARQPLKPPKIAVDSSRAAPPRPDKKPLDSGISCASSPITPVDEAGDKGFTFEPAAYLENGTPLRTVFLPPELRSTFLKYAEANTKANLETCGILCGTLISNALFISRLVIPEQESTSDTCDTVNEGALFDYCDAEDLMVLGWIHTHPSQTCFMSSRDLHTHSGYQVMMPEAIAIVCAPSKCPSFGVYRLTNPPGLRSILDCRQTGLFHPHAEQNIYTGAMRPGHVSEAPGLDFGVVDLRPKKGRK